VPTITIELPPRLASEIDRQAAGLLLSRSQYARLLIAAAARLGMAEADSPGTLHRIWTSTPVLETGPPRAERPTADLRSAGTSETPQPATGS